MINLEERNLQLGSADLSKDTEDLEKNYSSWKGLHFSTNATEFIRSHNSTVEYWKPFNDLREKTHNYAMGDTWDNQELQILKNKKKAPVRFNKIVTSIRAIVGLFINNKYDIKYSPMEPVDQNVSDVLKELYAWHYGHMNCKYKDPEIIKEAFIGGHGWQESYMEVQAGKEPKLVVINQNPFAIFPDPNSMDLVDRSDCEYIDRVGYYTLAQLQDMFPDKAIELYEGLYGAENRIQSYEQINRASDRSGENYNQINGKFKIIERFYRVKRRIFFGIDDKGDRQDIGLDTQADIEGLKGDYRQAGGQVYDEPYEKLFYAIACPQFNYNDFLINEEYHCQPIDPVTKRVMFPLYELIAESVGSEINGFVEYMMDPNKYINAMLGNKLHSAKHSASTSIIINGDKFEEQTANDLAKHHADGDRGFITKSGETVEGAVSLIPVGNTNPDNGDVLNYASNMVEEFVPPASKGLTTESGTSGKLNEQRIAQAQIQIVPFINNFYNFLTKRAKLWLYYDQTYITDEKELRITNRKSERDPESIKINQFYMAEDGSIKKWNDITTGEYDIVFEESFNSPQVRDKIKSEIMLLLQNPSVANDPTLATMLTLYSLQLTDAPQDFKDFFIKHSQVVQQAQAQIQAQEAQSKALDNTSKMQEIAQTEVDQTHLGELPQEGSSGQPQMTIPIPQLPQGIRA